VAGLVLITSGFPRRSETFALNEILALEGAGVVTRIFATKAGDGLQPQPGADGLLERVAVLPQAEPAEQAAMVAAQLDRRSVRGVHGYFAHTPAAVAAEVARRLDVPFSFSVHARDVRKVDRDELGRRIRGAAGVIACNTDVARDVSDRGGTVCVLPHGVDLERFQPRPLPPPEPLRMLAVGRLVEKKGFHVLVEAVARLSTTPIRLQIVGEGPERARLAAHIEAAGLNERVELCGGRTHAQLPDVYADAHVVVVPSVTDATGDRDGLPNVVLEALACGRPVIASYIGAVSDAVIPGETGLLVPPGDVAALADAIETLAAEPAFREGLARRGRRHVERTYELRHCTDRLQRTLETLYA